MRLIKYDWNFSRRHFIGQMTRGVLTTGVLMPLWQAIAASGEVTRAYPDELLSIEAYTRGRIKTGDEITADNVELVKDLLEPIRYAQIRSMGRRLRIAPTTIEILRLSPWEYVEATLRNRGLARFDAGGNVVSSDGRPWIGATRSRMRARRSRCSPGSL